MEAPQPRWQRVAERANRVGQRSGIQLVVVGAVVDPERLEHSALLANDGLLRVLRREHVREEGVVAMARQTDSHGDLSRRYRRGRAPRCLAQHCDIVLSLAHLVHRAEEPQHGAARLSRRRRPEGIRGDHASHVGNERGDGRRVRLAPDVDRRVRERLAQRRRERRREHEIAEVVERDDQNPFGGRERDAGHDVRAPCRAPGE
jgi:hypothetical protein